MAIRPATIIDGMAPATPMPTPTPNVASRIRGTLGATLAGGAEPGDQRDARRERQPRAEARGEPRAERREQAHAQDRDRRQQPGRSRPRGRGRRGSAAAAGRWRGAAWRSASDATNRPTTTAMGTRGAGGRHAPDAIGRRRAARSRRASVAGSATAVEEPVEDLAEHRLVRGRAMEQRHRRAQLDRVDPAEDVLRRAALRSRARWPAHSRSRGPSTGWARYARASSSERDRVEPRHLALPEPGDLREHEPHPVAGLAAGAQLGHDARVHALLGRDEALEVVRHRPIVRHTRRR